MRVGSMREGLTLGFSTPLCEIDRDVIVRAWSSGAESLTGKAEAEVIGRSCREVFGFGDASGKPVGSAPSEIAGHVLPLEQGDETLVRISKNGDYANVAVKAVAAQGQPADVLLLLLLEPNGEDGIPAPPPTLTDRQMDILRRLDMGEGTKEIALALQLSVHTVRHHIQAILSRLDSPTRLSALHKARAQHLL